MIPATPSAWSRANSFRRSPASCWSRLWTQTQIETPRSFEYATRSRSWSSENRRHWPSTTWCSKPSSPARREKSLITSKTRRSRCVGRLVGPLLDRRAVEVAPDRAPRAQPRRAHALREEAGIGGGVQARDRVAVDQRVQVPSHQHDPPGRRDRPDDGAGDGQPLRVLLPVAQRVGVAGRDRVPQPLDEAAPAVGLQHHPRVVEERGLGDRGVAGAAREPERERRGGPVVRGDLAELLARSGCPRSGRAHRGTRPCCRREAGRRWRRRGPGCRSRAPGGGRPRRRRTTRSSTVQRLPVAACVTATRAPLQRLRAVEWTPRHGKRSSSEYRSTRPSVAPCPRSAPSTRIPSGERLDHRAARERDRVAEPAPLVRARPAARRPPGAAQDHLWRAGVGRAGHVSSGNERTAVGVFMASP